MKTNLSNIKKSKFYLDKNECVGIPTETVYGLAANAYSQIATSKIFRLKLWVSILIDLTKSFFLCKLHQK